MRRGGDVLRGAARAPRCGVGGAEIDRWSERWVGEREGKGRKARAWRAPRLLLLFLSSFLSIRGAFPRAPLLLLALDARALASRGISISGGEWGTSKPAFSVGEALYMRARG